MARPSKSTTLDLIRIEEKNLSELIKQKDEIETKIKSTKQRIATLNSQHKTEKLAHIGEIAERSGLTIDKLLNALSDETVLSLLIESNATSTPNSDTNISTPVNANNTSPKSDADANGSIDTE